MMDMTKIRGFVGDLGLVGDHAATRLKRRWRQWQGTAGINPAIASQVPPQIGEIVEIDGIRMRIDPLMSDFNIRKLASGRHTVHERALLDTFLRDEDRVLELGGGIGMVAIACARRLGPGRVTSYEGNPRMETLIRENYALNEVAPDLRMAVVGPRDGEVTFYLAERFSHSAMTDNSNALEAVQVPMQDYAPVHAELRPTVLVIDIQGGEQAFFGHAPLDGVRMILVEFHPPITGLAPILAIRRRLRREGFAEVGRSGTSHVYLRDV